MLQEMCDQVMKRYWESAAKNYPVNLPIALPHLYHRINECVGSADNLQLIVETLAYQGQAATTVHNGTTYVKFLMPGDKSKPDITKADLAEVNLLCALEQVQDNINNINAEITEQQNNAKSSLQSGSKVQVCGKIRTQLNTRHFDKSLSKRLLHLSRQILHAFKTGVQAIRESIAYDLSAEGVANTMDELQEVLEECKDINSLLNTGVMEEDVDDTSLQEELEQLMSTDQKSVTHHEELTKSMSGLTLPDVPQSNPLSSLNTQPSSPTLKATP
ncbi:charged multivesicular body protein 7-like [Penaeus monodon]|uniref:charged multivesicular body protein 7-like n=1 Tax=Penaeus monodon TaxID=6687 RepID=UPI0018A7CDEA|nr:charged multivesicular body protein 7-like [Penaeus monodon]